MAAKAIWKNDGVDVKANRMESAIPAFPRGLRYPISEVWSREYRRNIERGRSANGESSLQDFIACLIAS